MPKWVRLAVASFALFVFVAAGSLAFAPPAWAQPAVAQKALGEGDRAARENKWEEALAAYKKAHEASPSAATELRMANALYKLGRTVEAADAYEALVATRGSSLLGGDKKLAKERLEELSGKTGTVAVRVSESGATISVDGKPVGTSPLAKPIRVLFGARKVLVAKEGFSPFESTVEVAAKAAVSVDVDLKAKPKGGSVMITVKGGGEPLTVFVDEKSFGPTPIKVVLPVGSHTITARGPSLVAGPTVLEVKEGDEAQVELVPGPPVGTLEIRTDPEKSKIEIDGKDAGPAPVVRELTAGEHTMTVSRDGYQPVTKKLTIEPGEVLVETISLRKKAAGAIVEKIEQPWSFNGLYGGFQLMGMFEPAGSGNTLEGSCAVTGATSCDAGIPLGGGLGGFIGYAFAPLGLELFLLGAGDVVQPTASFDGKSGSEVNPLVASPAREEEFVIGRFGGGGAARIRLLFPVDIVRFTGAIGAGVAYRHLLLGRDTVADSGATSSVGNKDGDGYVSGVLSVDLGAQVLLVGTTSLALGASLWLEHAGDGVTTPARGDVYLTKDGVVPAPQATPAYVMASGTQVFIGPYVGMFFGP
jgi:hypothetical protein